MADEILVINPRKLHARLSTAPGVAIPKAGHVLVWADDDGNIVNGAPPAGTIANSDIMLRSVYDKDEDNIADKAKTVPWTGITGKPEVFPAYIPKDIDTAAGTSVDVSDFSGNFNSTDDTVQKALHKLDRMNLATTILAGGVPRGSTRKLNFGEGLTATVNGDRIDIAATSVAQDYITITTSQVLAFDIKYLVDTTVAQVLVGLPLGTDDDTGKTIELWDAHGTWDTNCCTVETSGGQTLAATDGTLFANIKYTRLVFVFAGASKGWYMDIGGMTFVGAGGTGGGGTGGIAVIDPALLVTAVLSEYPSGLSIMDISLDDTWPSPNGDVATYRFTDGNGRQVFNSADYNKVYQREWRLQSFIGPGGLMYGDFTAEYVYTYTSTFGGTTHLNLPAITVAGHTVSVGFDAWDFGQQQAYSVHLDGIQAASTNLPTSGTFTFVIEIIYTNGRLNVGGVDVGLVPYVGLTNGDVVPTITGPASSITDWTPWIDLCSAALISTASGSTVEVQLASLATRSMTPGPQGPQGENGLSGSQGPQGEYGGPQGLQGPQGANGLNGTNGTNGTQGPQGAYGGPQGDIGPQGSNGAPGTQGPRGDDGAPGTQGPQGEYGGPQGTQGTQGTQGQQGVTGVQGASVQGPQGVQGLQGVQGYVGSQGSQGPQGASVQGPQGPQGASVQGPQGNQGPQGVQGSNSGNTYITNLIEERVLSSDETTVTFSGLDSLTDGTYFIDYTLEVNSAPSGGDIYINGNMTATNYWARLAETGSSTGAWTYNHPYFQFLTAGYIGLGTIKIIKMASGIVVIDVNCVRDDPSYILTERFIIKTTFTVTAVTTITLQNDGLFKVGSTFSLYKSR